MEDVRYKHGVIRTKPCRWLCCECRYASRRHLLFTIVERKLHPVGRLISSWQTPGQPHRWYVAIGSAGSSNQFRPCGNAYPVPTNRRTNPLKKTRIRSFISFSRYLIFTTNLFNNIFQLHYGYAYQPIIARKAIVLDADVKFKWFQSLLIANDTNIFKLIIKFGCS